MSKYVYKLRQNLEYLKITSSLSPCKEYYYLLNKCVCHDCSEYMPMCEGGLLYRCAYRHEALYRVLR